MNRLGAFFESPEPAQIRSADALMKGSMMVSDTHRWLLCTGQPGSGKTTLVRRLYETLSDKGVSLRGFYTDEVLDKPGGTRIGFDIVTIPNGERGILSRKRGLPTTFPRTGAYVVDVASFESLALPSISCPSHNNNNNNDIAVIVIDEIGRMELHSNEFQHCIQQLLASPSVRVIGAITSPIMDIVFHSVMTLHQDRRCLFGVLPRRIVMQSMMKC